MSGENTLFYGDNLAILREEIPSESVDLVYLDPPFNSNRSYNVLFKTRAGDESPAQMEAFDDTWKWGRQPEQLWDELILTGGAPDRVAETLTALRSIIGDNDLLAYLVMMTARLVELHRVLKPTGTLYLHCDPTASHYLKIILDAIFRAQNFRSEIIWKRTSAHSSARRCGPVHDVILVYTKSDRYTWNPQFQPYETHYLEEFYTHTDPDGRRWRRSDLTGAGVRSGPSGQPWRGIDVSQKGRHWSTTPNELDKLDAAGKLHWPAKSDGMPMLKRYADEQRGVPLQDVWTDIRPMHNLSAERLGYPTQKPVALLDRIVAASSNPGDFVLDPFCGCGTAIDSAQKLGRRWIGIDITILAIDVIKRRLQDAYGDQILHDFAIKGTPTELVSAERLARERPFEFERWAVTLVDGTPNERQVGDRGIDGVIRFLLDPQRNTGRALVSVKGGQQINPGMVRDLSGTIKTHHAEMGLLITMRAPTPGMLEAAARDGFFDWPFTHQRFPRTQIVTVEDLIVKHRRPDMPNTIITPYLQAPKSRARSHNQSTFF